MILIDMTEANGYILAILGVGLIFNKPLEAALQSLAGLIENLGSINHMFLVDQDYPPNVELFTSTLFPLVTFDVLGIDGMNEKIYPDIRSNDPIYC